MKKVLSLLVAFIFLQVQSWALSGGPQYGAVNNNVSGTWSGTMVGTIGSNGLGLFELGIPTEGLGSGIFAFYVGGGAFFGTVVALADGTKNTMSGVFKGYLSETVFVAVTNGTTTTLQPNTVDVALMGGSFTATITGDTGGTSSIGIGARLHGAAATTIASAGNRFAPAPVGLTLGNTTLILDGFEQSSAVTGQVSLNNLTQTTSSGAGGSGG